MATQTTGEMTKLGERKEKETTEADTVSIHPHLQTNEDKNDTREMPETQKLPSFSPHYSNFNVESANCVTT